MLLICNLHCCHIVFMKLQTTRYINIASSPLNNGGGGIWWNLQNFLWSCQFSWNEWGISVYGGTKLNNHKEGGGELSLIILFKNKNIKLCCNFLKNLPKTKVLRYSTVMISEFCTAGHLILIFIRRILPPLRTIWAFQGVSYFSNKCSFTVYT